MTTHEQAVRVARPDDTDALVALVNDAYRVEAFFVGGDRTASAEISQLIDASEVFVVDDELGVAACVHVAVHEGRGYFGMLAVRPDAQGKGLARLLIEDAEARVRAAGCQWMDIKVVNLRTDLVPFYERLGYVAGGTEPYVHRPVLQPCHFVLMTKRLAG